MRILITRATCILSLIILNVAVVSSQSLENNRSTDPPVPVYKTLKNLYLNTAIVANNQPQIVIVSPNIYSTESSQIQATIKNLTGINVSIVNDQDADGLWPLRGNVILLGNRSTNELISDLYDRGYTFLDLKYPGKGGYVVRSLHNPLGNGKNVLFVGGSDDEGVKASTVEFIKLLKGAHVESGIMTVGYLSKIKLGDDYSLPDDIEDAKIWDASEEYRSSGYFGWNIISKNMALYYMTGKERYLEEFLRLSFPDSAAIREIAEKDGERIEDKKHPLSGPYHYNASMMIEMWDLIEESPLLTDEERLKITNAFARQLEHRMTEYGSIYWITKPPRYVFDRHYDWAAFSLYALGRYFEKDYPDTVWKHCLNVTDLYFSRLKNSYWAAGDDDVLPWFGSYFDPALDYLLYSGKRDQDILDNLRRALNTEQVLSTGKSKDWALTATSLSMLNKAAYILKDGRWLYYRKHINLNTNTFRLGQSFWPDSSTLKPVSPVDLAGVWDIQWMPDGMWKSRSTGFPKSQSFRWGSYRSELGPGGDYVLLKGYNGAGRDPYHTFDILELRLNGSTLMKGFHNQILTSADGMVEPKVAMDAALLYNEVVGQVTAAAGYVPNLAFVKWTRSLALRKGHYVLIADQLNFRTNSDNILVKTTWEMPGASWDPEKNLVKIQPRETSQVAYELRSSEAMEVMSGKVTTMSWRGSVQKGQNHVFFHLLGQSTPGSNKGLACQKLSDNAAALALPEAAIAVAGTYKNIEGDLVLLSEKTLYGHALRAARLSRPLLLASSPIEVDWDFKSGKLEIVNQHQVTVSLALTSSELVVNGKLVTGKLSNGLYTFNLLAGDHKITHALPSAELLRICDTQLPALLAQTDQSQKQQKVQITKQSGTAVLTFTPVMKAKIGGKPIPGIVIPSVKGDILGIATGNTVTIINQEGKEVRKLTTPGEIRVLRWWKEPKLLLVGCADEKVIAFDDLGRKKWEFTSLMDSAVFEAGKQYWFKSRYPGIYGLYSGYFDNGKSRAFVGSACTLEILDENGQLVKRMPVFWGNLRQFLIVDAPDGSKNLLAGRWQNGFDYLSIINSKKLNVTGQGYFKVPPGYTFVNGWTAMNRFDNFLVDLYGNGKREVVSAINGAWNRVTIYSEDGKPLYNAQFGPGSPEPRSTMRMMDVGNITGDEKLEIVVGVASGLVVVLDGQAKKLWAKALSSPPTVVKIIKGKGASWLCVGSEDGTISALSGSGDIIKQGKVNGRPEDLQVMQTPKGAMAVITTDKGEVNGFRIN